MNLAAVYRCLYGEDFIQESIRSVMDVVDRVFVVWDDRPWGGVDHCIYRGERVDFPKPFDDILGRIRALECDKVELIHDHVENNLGQFTHIVNDLIIPDFGRPAEVLVVEVDHVFRSDQLKAALQEFRTRKLRNCSTRQVELWRTLEYRIPERPYRTGAVLWSLDGLDALPPTKRQAEGDDMQQLSAFVHNLGFCFSERTMYWKHMTALGFSKAIGDSAPNEGWYEDKWLSWDYRANNENLEIAKGYEHLIPFAEPYPRSELPEVLREREL